MIKKFGLPILTLFGVGREGRNAEKARLLLKRYFNITNIVISNQAPQLEM